MKKYKVLITYVEAGIGHYVSAEACKNALEKYYPDEVEVEKFYILQEGSERLKKHEKFLVDQVKLGYKHKGHLNFLFFIQHIFTPLTTLKLVHNVAFRKEKKECMDLLMKKDADMVLSTHYEPLHFAVCAQKEKKAKFITACYNPDPNDHSWWDMRCDAFFVNNEKVVKEALRHGFKKETVKNVGLLIRDRVKDFTGTKEEMRIKYGISENEFTIVMADGAYAQAKLKTFADELIKSDKKFTILLIAGKNQELFDYYTEISKTLKNITLKVFGFTEDVHELYKAADLFVSKAGPNAISDSAFMGTPVLTNYYSGNIEKKTKELYIDEYGLGMHIPELADAVETINSFIDEPSLLDPYRNNCEKFRSRGTGEKAIADEIMKLLKERK